MLAIGTPLYVCATGSIPIAASLILKGISPGAWFVFLIAGPATNIVTMLFVDKTLGKKFHYLHHIHYYWGGFFGWLLDIVMKYFTINISEIGHKHDGFSIVSYISSFILVFFAVNSGISVLKQKFITQEQLRKFFLLLMG